MARFQIVFLIICLAFLAHVAADASSDEPLRHALTGNEHTDINGPKGEGPMTLGDAAGPKAQAFLRGPVLAARSVGRTAVMQRLAVKRSPNGYWWLAIDDNSDHRLFILRSEDTTGLVWDDAKKVQLAGTGGLLAAAPGAFPYLDVVGNEVYVCWSEYGAVGTQRLAVAKINEDASDLNNPANWKDLAGDNWNADGPEETVAVPNLHNGGPAFKFQTMVHDSEERIHFFLDHMSGPYRFFDYVQWTGSTWSSLIEVANMDGASPFATNRYLTSVMTSDGWIHTFFPYYDGANFSLAHTKVLKSQASTPDDFKKFDGATGIDVGLNPPCPSVDDPPCPEHVDYVRAVILGNDDIYLVSDDRGQEHPLHLFKFSSTGGLQSGYPKTYFPEPDDTAYGGPSLGVTNSGIAVALAEHKPNRVVGRGGLTGTGDLDLGPERRIHHARRLKIDNPNIEQSHDPALSDELGFAFAQQESGGDWDLYFGKIEIGGVTTTTTQGTTTTAATTTSGATTTTTQAGAPADLQAGGACFNCHDDHWTDLDWSASSYESWNSIIMDMMNGYGCPVTDRRADRDYLNSINPPPGATTTTQ